jgi:hypothetical protein
MVRVQEVLATAAVLCLGAGVALAAEPADAAGHFAMHGGAAPAPVQLGGTDAPGTPGTLWANGPSNSVNGLASERATWTTGTGGPEGDHIATVAEDFYVSQTSQVTEIRVCLYHDGTTAEMYIYADAAGAPGPSVGAPLFGAPTGADVASTTFNDQTARCTAAFGFPGREYVFNPQTTGVTFPVLPAGRYWLAVVGEGGSRAFWADANPSPSPDAAWGSDAFAFPYWSPTSAQGQPDFAFDIDGGPLSTLIEVPTLSGIGLAALALLVAGASFFFLKRRATLS